MLLRQIGQRIDRALQNMRRGKGVDLLGALGPADVGLDHRPLDRLRRPALVPEQDRKLKRSKIASEGADGLGPRAIAAVHVERQADDQADDCFAFERNSAGCSEVGGELGPADCFGRPGKAPARIADRQADRLRSDVEPGELAVSNGRREFGGVAR